MGRVLRTGVAAATLLAAAACTNLESEPVPQGATTRTQLLTTTTTESREAIAQRADKLWSKSIKDTRVEMGNGGTTLAVALGTCVFWTTQSPEFATVVHNPARKHASNAEGNMDYYVMVGTANGRDMDVLNGPYQYIPNKNGQPDIQRGITMWRSNVEQHPNAAYQDINGLTHYTYEHDTKVGWIEGPDGVRIAETVTVPISKLSGALIQMCGADFSQAPTAPTTTAS